VITIAKLPMGIRNSLRAALTRRPPKHLSRRFRQIDRQSMERLEVSLKRSYFGDSNGYLFSEEGLNELQDHLTQRTNTFRTTVIPWLDHAKPLAGATILEIGCGTGSSTVTLAEQGARVTAMDISEGSLTVARERCALYGLDVDFVHANATEAHRLFSGRRFDFLIFFATLEHMTHDERLAAMTTTWAMLSEGDFWCVIDTPNRLWFYDSHTSRLPFYHWLPDDVAFAYSRFSPRTKLSDRYRDKNEEEMLSFLRQGRGVSFHEFDLTMGSVKDLKIVSSLALFLRSQNVLRRAAWQLSTECRYAALLASVEPRIHSGFYQQYLDLIIQKG
jgi:2-polyprenyl-3-methyl-5-hydroxy-6-metoxy-1,4-benzoquinol methylase